jgi:hypothetical protein
MKTVLEILSRIAGDYTTKRIEVKPHLKVIPREGERFTYNGESYYVKNVHYDYDNNTITISCL